MIITLNEVNLFMNKRQVKKKYNLIKWVNIMDYIIDLTIENSEI